ncbi:MAG: HlyD family efflux transporter periplasmic adaptor subunit [Lentisphaeraceae bacterium]|nr:HlyD family efflux transporter periplasmic adaptor subunit [Lentisphaeraceae bacterium]
MKAFLYTVLAIAGIGGFIWSILPAEEEIKIKAKSEVTLKQVSRAVIERGKIQASDKSIIQSFISGSIISIKPNGTYVKKGDIVARIDSSNYEDDILEYGLDLKAERLLLEISRKRLELIKSYYGNEVLEDKENLRHAELAYEEEMAKPTDDEMRRLNISLKLAKLSLEEAEANIVRQTRLYDKGFLSKASLEPHQRRLASRKEKVNEAELNIQVAKKGIPQEQKVTLEQNLLRAEASLERRQKRRQRKIDEQEDIIKVSEQKIAEMEFKRKSLIEKSKQSICYADREGYVIIRTYYDWRSGGKYTPYAPGVQVRERDALVEVVSPGKMIVDAIFNESDFHNLKVDQKVDVTLPALPGKVFKGTLVSLGAIGKDRNDWMKELRGTSGVSMYNGSVAFDVDNEKFQPGMSAILSIYLTKSYQALTLPRSAVAKIDSKFFVDVRGSLVEVSGRVLNEFDFEIKSGLEEGAKVTTVFPKDRS